MHILICIHILTYSIFFVQFHKADPPSSFEEKVVAGDHGFPVPVFGGVHRLFVLAPTLNHTVNLDEKDDTYGYKKYYRCNPQCQIPVKICPLNFSYRPIRMPERSLNVLIAIA